MSTAIVKWWTDGAVLEGTIEVEIDDDWHPDRIEGTIDDAVTEMWTKRVTPGWARVHPDAPQD